MSAVLQVPVLFNGAVGRQFSPEKVFQIGAGCMDHARFRVGLHRQQLKIGF